MARFSTPARTLGQQQWLMSQKFPAFHYSRQNNIATWKGALQPTRKSPVYLIKVNYRYANQQSKAPKVWVLNPEIHPNAKHRYPDASLCLYFPKDGSWSPHKFIAETIVPWAALWLLFYEIWLDTDFWYGPEAPHSGPKK
jgi:hypothetical protein